MNKILSLAAAAALSMGAMGMPAASSRITVGNDRTRYTWVNKPKLDPVTRQLQKDIAAWNAAVEAKKAAKGKRVR